MRWATAERSRRQRFSSGGGGGNSSRHSSARRRQIAQTKMSASCCLANNKNLSYCCALSLSPALQLRKLFRRRRSHYRLLSCEATATEGAQPPPPPPQPRGSRSSEQCSPPPTTMKRIPAEVCDEFSTRPDNGRPARVGQLRAPPERPAVSRSRQR